MPQLHASYKAPAILFNGHLQTIYPALFRKPPMYRCNQYRISTRDKDELVLDHHVGSGRRKAVVLCHGLEGNSRKPYVLGMAHWYNKAGWDVFAWNYRGCAGGPNRTLRFYHSGATDDLEDVLLHILENGFETVTLVGFSLGGNLIMKYLGEQTGVFRQIRSAVVFSVPLDLYAGARHLHRPQNRIYELRFLRSLKKKVLLKHQRFPDLDIEPLPRINSLIDFDDCYTAPIHGFENAADYYRKCSALHFLDTIRIPTLLVNAVNDPFLTQECTPHDKLGKHPFVYLMAPRQGGHTGFATFNSQSTYWSEKRALEFSEQHM